MQVSKAGDKQIRALALEFAGDLDDYSESITQKAMNASTDIQELIDEVLTAINELSTDVLETREKQITTCYNTYVKYADIA